MKCPVCKKNISDTALKCPYCKTRTGILCNHCNTINPIGSLYCKKCGKELLKLCSHCNSVNFPNAQKCRKCGSPFGINKKQGSNNEDLKILEYKPQLFNRKQALSILTEGLLSRDRKVFSITGEKGIGKTTLLNNAISALKNEKFEWSIGKCTQLTQLTPGGVIQDMLLNLFKLPNYCINNEDINSDAVKFFSKEFKFLNNNEILDFINFLYNSKDGNYEDIIINKKRTCSILNKIFDAFCNTGRFIFVIDNFDFIDGFSIEFLTNFVRREANWKKLKLILIYNEYKPVNSILGFDGQDLKAFVDVNLALLTPAELEKNIKISTEAGAYLSEQEKSNIIGKSKGNPAFMEQAVSYCFDCQISDKAFILPGSFTELIKERLSSLKKNNQEAYKLLSGSAILGNKLNLSLLKEIFGYKHQEFNDIMSYLAKSKFVRKYNETYFEFNNLFLWETVLKNVQKDPSFEDINVKVGKALSVFTLNTNATMAMIAHNLKENRMAFDIWTKTTRLASYVGDINLYVISQKQCLALLNEFNENETLNIRYNISERLGKLLTEYDPEEAVEFLPDAISNARGGNNETKEIELLGYLSTCCQKIGNYFGDIECIDNVLKKLTPSQELERAMIKSSKIPSLINIGNCGEAVNLIDNDIMPIINSNLTKPKLNKNIPLGFLYDTWVRLHLYLAAALTLQGNNRAFEVINKLFNIVEKHKINDDNLIYRTKLVKAYATSMKGDFYTSQALLADLSTTWKAEKSEISDSNINNYNLINIINLLQTKQYDNLREELYDSALFAQDTGNEFLKNIFKTFLGKVICDSKQAKHALEIYNEQINYFADKKLAFGALLCWYLIAEASIITESTKSAIDIIEKALEISQNPQINNHYFTAMLKVLLSRAYMELSDYETAKANLDSALGIAKKYDMQDLLSKIYYIYGKCYQDIGTVSSPNQTEYLKGSIKMYDKSLDIINKTTKSEYLKNLISNNKELINSYCTSNGISL
ncbi:hypothetical protein IJ541_10280 [bacterium]|nr:hypothetical protein [bacterium]